MKKLSYKTLYILWAVMHVLTAALGFAFPAPGTKALQVVLVLISVLYFLPPWLVMKKAKDAAERFHVHLVGFLAVGSLVLTVLVLILSIMSPLWSEAVGYGLYAALIIVSAPMTCGNVYAVSLFLWGTLIAEAFFKK